MAMPMRRHSATYEGAFTEAPAPPGFRPFDRADVHGTLTARFRQMVSLHPDLPAVADAHTRLSYVQLDRAADRVAGALETAGVGPGDRVAILTGNAAGFAAAVLGSLRQAACSYLFDPSYPRRQLDALIDSSGCRAVLTVAQHAAFARELSSNVVVVDALLDGPSVAPWPDHANADSLAYVMFTSGSTRRPKGLTQVTNVLHYVREFVNKVKVGPGNRVALIPSSATAASLSDSYGALLSGAVLLPVDVKAVGLVNLGAWLESQQVTHYHSVPTFWDLMASLNPCACLESVRVVRGGEPARAADLELFRRRYCQRRIARTAFRKRAARCNLRPPSHSLNMPALRRAERYARGCVREDIRRADAWMRRRRRTILWRSLRIPECES